MVDIDLNKHSFQQPQVNKDMFADVATLLIRTNISRNLPVQTIHMFYTNISNTKLQKALVDDLQQIHA